MILKTRGFDALINNFGPHNYLIAALVNFTFKAHFQRLAAAADVAEHWWWWWRGVGGLINALPLLITLVVTHGAKTVSGLSSETPVSISFCDEQKLDEQH